MRFRSRMKVDDEVPTSSMADIAFLLIIFFMVTTVFAARKGFVMQLPTPNTQPAEPESSQRAVYIRIYEDDRLRVDQQDMSLEDFSAYAQQKVAENPQKFFIVHPKEKAKFGRVIDVLDELRILDIKNVTVPTKEEVASWGPQPFLDD